MPLVSSAQNQEDIMLWRALRQVVDGFYIDIGAADPAALSVTRIFYDHGWHGINLEPNPAYFTALRAARPRDVTLPFGAGRAAGQQPFYLIEGSGLSTFDAAIAARHRAAGWTVTERTADTVTLADICRRHRPQGPIHFLKIDVEGAEGDVLAGADFGTFRPWIVLVEAVLPLSLEPSYAAWEPLLISQGYMFAWFDGLNRFYIDTARKQELEPCFRVPPNVFDGFMPASDLLERAEHAEQHLHDVEMRATEAVTALAKQSSLTTAARLEAGMLEGQLAEARRQNATLSRRHDETGLALTATEQRLRDSLAVLADAREQARLAELQLVWMRASTSWRLTAPLRAVSRLLRGGRVGQAPRIRPVAGGPIGKEAARRIFHRGMYRLLRLPGGRQGVRLVRSIAPGAVEWLALRYRAYDRRSVEPRPAEPVSVADVDAMLAAGRMASLDLSEEEARIYRGFVTARLAAPPDASRA